MSNKIDDVFVSFRADSTELERGLQDIEREIDKTVSFIVSKPTVALAGLSVALLGIAADATRMAADVDNALQGMVASAPQTIAQLGQIRDTIRDLSTESGRSQTDLAQGATLLARLGVQSASDIQTLLTAGVTAADASGVDLTTVLTGLDRVGKEFHLTAEQDAQALADIFASAKGHAPLDEVFGILEKTGPAADATGLSLGQMTNVIVDLIEKGLNVKQVAAEINKLAKEGDAGKKALDDMAGSAQSSADNMNALEAAATTSRESAGKLGDILKQNLNAELIELGNQILPSVIGLLKDLDQTLSAFDGQARSVEVGSLVTTIGDLSGILDKLGSKERADAVQRIFTNLQNLAGVVQDGNFGKIDRNGFGSLFDALNTSISSFPTATLQTMERGLLSLGQDVPTAQVTAYNNALLLLSKTIASRPDKGGSVAPPKSAPIGDPKADAAAEAARQKIADEIQANLSALLKLAADGSAAINDKLLGAWQNLNDQVDGHLQKLLKLVDPTNQLGAAQAKLANAPNESAAAKAAAELDAVYDRLIAKSPALGTAIQAAAQIQADFWKKASSDFTTTESSFEQSFQKEMQATAAQTTKDLEAVNDAYGKLKDTPFASQAFDILNDSTITLTEKAQKLGDLLKAAGIATTGINDGLKGTKDALNKIADGQLTIIQRQRQFVDAVLAGVNALAGMLKATGLISDGLATDIGNVVTFAEKAGSLADTIEKLSIKTVDKLGNVVSAASTGDVVLAAAEAAAALVPVLGSIFGESAAQKAEDSARAQAEADAVKHTQDLAAALAALADKVNKFGDETLSGAAFGALANRLPQIVAGSSQPVQGPGGPVLDDSGNPVFASSSDSVKQALAAVGVSIADVDAAANQLGITLTDKTAPTLEELTAISKGLQEEKFAQFANDFTDQLAELQAGFKVFNTTGSAQFAPFLTLLTDPKVGAPAIFNALQGIDVSTVSGASQATTILQGIFQQFKDGKIDPADFGGLNPTDFLNTIQTLLGLLPQVTTATAAQTKAETDSLAVRNLTAAGDTAGAAALQRQQQEQAEIDQALAAGYDDVTIAAIKATQAAEDQAAAVQKATDQANENESLIVRQLRAAGSGDAADALQRQIDETQEIADAIAKGFDASTIAAIKATQAQEDLAAAQTKAAAAAQAQADEQDSLAVRLLRATGQGDAADLLALQQSQAKELSDAIAQGFDQATIDQLKSTQAAELAQLQQSQATAAQQASATAQGVSGTSGNTTSATVTSNVGETLDLVGLAETANALLQEIVANTKSLRSGGPLLPPSLASLQSPGALGSGSVTLTIGSIPITVTVTSASDDPASLGNIAGTAAGRGFLDALNRQFGFANQRSAINRGDNPSVI